MDSREPAQNRHRPKVHTCRGASRQLLLSPLYFSSTPEFSLDSRFNTGAFLTLSPPLQPPPSVWRVSRADRTGTRIAQKKVSRTKLDTGPIICYWVSFFFFFFPPPRPTTKTLNRLLHIRTPHDDWRRSHRHRHATVDLSLTAGATSLQFDLRAAESRHWRTYRKHIASPERRPRGVQGAAAS